MFIVVRHGNTFAADEQPRRIGARTDLPLTTEGVEQARMLGRHFAAHGWRFDRVLVSPLMRARQTAHEILAEQADAPAAQEVDFLREVDHGPDENMPESAIVDRIGQQAVDAWDTDATIPSGWIVEPQKRKSAWQQLFAEGADADAITLLVTSNGAARFALLADPDLQSAAESLPSLKLPTGGFGVIKRRADGTLALESWGVRP